MLAVLRRSKNFRPAADPLHGGVGRPKFNQLEMVTTFIYKPSLVRIDAHLILKLKKYAFSVLTSGCMLWHFKI